ncbi:MAG TPA: hypothetical protein VNM91_07865 [Dehalococcoidia bacterium]|nr:hypothetical protein [Dehalococcoidia bacterium]
MTLLIETAECIDVAHADGYLFRRAAAQRGVRTYMAVEYAVEDRDGLAWFRPTNARDSR